MEYRKEIDGLRALAVVPVMLFHAGFDAFGGGFVGVDVFFVISGYLITTILLEELEQGRFSLINFYERRARRILPALFLVVLACIPFAWFWLLPSDQKDFAQSLVAVSVFASNILFWSESGYFDTAAELKPLLHTWSLAVEEQYYVLFPLFLMLSWRLGRRWLAVFLVVAGLASFAVAEWASHAAPAAAFYLLPARGWELLLGAFAAYFLSKENSYEFCGVAREAGGWLGLLLIVYSVHSYSKVTPFPGVYALAPTVGALLIIVFATQQTVAGRFLGNKLFVGVGLLSYGAYLWHQPLFAFARVRLLGEPGSALMIALCGLSILLAFFSRRYVEDVFRRRSGFSGQAVFRLAVGGAFVLSVVGLLMASPLFLSIRYDSERQKVIGDMSENREIMKNSAFDRGRCFFDFSQRVDVLFENHCVSPAAGVGRVVLFGDSEAAHYSAGFESAAVNSGYRVMQFTGAGCRAIDHGDSSDRCREFYAAFFDRVIPLLNERDVVVVSSNWWITHKAVGDDAFFRALIATVNKLKKSGAEIVVVGNTPDFIEDPYELILRLGAGGNSYLPVVDYRSSNAVIAKVARETKILYFDPAVFLCNGDSCRFKDGDDYLFYDSGHLSRHGSEVVVRQILQTLQVFD